MTFKYSKSLVLFLLGMALVGAIALILLVAWGTATKSGTKEVAAIPATPTLNPALYANLKRAGDGTWVQLYQISPAPTLLDITCPTLNNCYAVRQDGQILATKNAGLNWQIISAPAIKTGYQRKLACPTALVCYLTKSDNQVAKTSDGGLTWTVTNYPTALLATPIKLTCPSELVCYSNDEGDEIATTNDGGLTWQIQKSGVTLPIAEISCPSPLVCLAAANDNADKHFYSPQQDFKLRAGAVLKTLDGGQTWKKVAESVEVAFTKLTCPSVSTCYALQDYAGDTSNIPVGIMQTSDGGQTWQKVGKAIAPGTIACPTAQICYSTTYEGKVLVTQDSGKSWQTQDTGSGRSNFVRNLSCPQATLCYALATGEKSIILLNIPKP